MPSLTFEGIVTGAAVSLSAQQGGNSDSASVTTWGQADSSSLNLAVSASRSSGVAPFGALFTADATSMETRVVSPFHDIEGVWDYGSPGNFTALDNSPLWGTDSNIGYGPRGVHVHETPGTYQVAHTAYDGAGTRTETMTVTVEDPDVVFAGADTAVMSAAGNFSGAPAGASTFTSLSAAISHVEGRTNGRLLLRADETFTSNIVIDKPSGRVLVGRFGHSGAERPLLDMSSSNQTAVIIRGANLSEIVVCDLRIRGGYDPTATSQPNAPNGSGIDLSGNVSDKPLDAHKTIWNVEMENLGNMGIDCDGVDFDTPNRRLYVGNTRIIGWFNYGILGGDAGDWGFAGCVFKQPTGTVNGQFKSSSSSHTDFWADHGPFRLSRPLGMTVFSNCDFTSFNDWSAGGDSQSLQDVIRWNAGTHADQELVIDRFRGEGGGFNIYNLTNGSNSGVTDNYVLIDRMFFVDSEASKYCLTSPMGGVTWRNCIGVLPNIPAGESTGSRRMFSDDPDGANINSGARTRRSEFYSNALIDLRNDQNASTRGPGNNNRAYNPGGYEFGLQSVSGTFFGNNLLHAPNMATGGETAHAPLNTTPQWDVWWDGERWEGAPVDTSRAYGNTPTASFAPEPGSIAIGSASGKVSLMDFYGNLRTDILAGLTRSTPSIGPYEPDLEN